MSRSSLKPALLAALLLLPGTSASARSNGAIPSYAEPTQRAKQDEGEPFLTAGYKDVRWGQNRVGLQALRGLLQPQADADPHIEWRLEQQIPGEDVSQLAHYKLWDDQLIEVEIHYQGRFTPTEGAELVAKFEDRYGPARHDEVSLHGTKIGRGATDTEREEHWTWQDRFTIQILRRRIGTEQWSCFRRSRILEAHREHQARKEAKERLTGKVKKIELD